MFAPEMGRQCGLGRQQGRRKRLRLHSLGLSEGALQTQNRSKGDAELYRCRLMRLYTFGAARARKRGAVQAASGQRTAQTPVLSMETHVHTQRSLIRHTDTKTKQQQRRIGTTWTPWPLRASRRVWRTHNCRGPSRGTRTAALCCTYNKCDQWASCTHNTHSACGYGRIVVQSNIF